MTSHMQPAGPRRTTGSPPPAVTWFVRLAEMGDAFGMQELLAADRTIVSLPDAVSGSRTPGSCSSASPS